MDQAAIVTRAMNEGELAVRHEALRVEEGAVADAIHAAGSPGSSPRLS
jgi:hypothetical protein